MPMGRSQNEPVRPPPPWRVDIKIRGNLLLSEQAALKAFVITRGGVIRDEPRGEDIVYLIQMPSAGPNCQRIIAHVADRVAQAVHGDRIEAMIVGCRRGAP